MRDAEYAGRKRRVTDRGRGAMANCWDQLSKIFVFRSEEAYAERSPVDTNEGVTRSPIRARTRLEERDRETTVRGAASGWTSWSES